MQTVPHPTKEQVRAYMHQRGRAHRPPPAPDEIRRQLGWDWPCPHYAYGSMDGIFAPSILPASPHYLILPGTIVQLTALMAVEWLFLASGFSRSR